MKVFVINVATNSTKKIQSLQTIDIGTIKACAAFQRRNKMMVIVAGAVMTALLDLSTKDGNWTIGLIKVIKREVVTKKFSTISAHIFLKLVEFYFGKENIFLLK